MTKFKLTKDEFKLELDKFINYWGSLNTSTAKIYSAMGEAVRFAIFLEPQDLAEKMGAVGIDWDYDEVNDYLDTAIRLWEDYTNGEGEFFYGNQGCSDRHEAFLAIKGMISDD